MAENWENKFLEKILDYLKKRGEANTSVPKIAIEFEFNFKK